MWPAVRRNATVRSEELQTLVDVLTGVAGAGDRVQLTRYNNASNYALDVRNLDTNNSYGLRVRDAVDANLLLVYKDNITVGANVTVGASLTVDGLDLSAHAHTGAAGHGVQVAHTSLTDIGTNTHAQVDTHIAATSAHGASSNPGPAAAMLTTDDSGLLRLAGLNIGGTYGMADGQLHIANPATTLGATNNIASWGHAVTGNQTSHAGYGTTGDWYIRSVLTTGKVIIQDTATRIGIGTADVEAWAAGYIGLEGPKQAIMFGSDPYVWLMANAYYGSPPGGGATNWRRKTAAIADLLQMGVNVLSYHQAATGAIDSVITWTEQFRVHTNGNVGIGEAAPASYPLHVRRDQNANTAIQVLNNTAGVSAQAQLRAVNDGGMVTIVGRYSSLSTATGALVANAGFLYSSGAAPLVIMAAHAAADIVLASGGTAAKAQLYASGGLHLGATPADPGANNLKVEGNLRVGNTNYWTLAGWTTNADAAVNGYVTVTVDGVTRKLATIA